MPYAPDIHDWFDHRMREDAMQYERWLASRPCCSECDHAITDDECYEINDELICIDCMEEHHKKAI